MTTVDEIAIDNIQRKPKYLSLISLLVAGLVGTFFAIGQSLLPHGGFIPIITFILGLIFIPSARLLTARIALNGVLLFGLLPILWWGTTTLNLAYITATSNTASGLIAGLAVFFTLNKYFARQEWLPVFRTNDALVGIAALFMIWLYLPFINGVSSTSALLQSMGGDIVAHFTMVVKTIETGVSGAGWGTAPDGTHFVYVNYPQHFHTIAAYLGESFTKVDVGSVESNASSFMAGLALTIILSVTILSSLMLVSLEKVKGVFLSGLLVIASTATLSAGFGASNLQSGFPNFVLAAIGVLYVFYISIQSNKLSPLWLIASASGLLLVVNSWFLLSPIALGLFAMALWRIFTNAQLSNFLKWSASLPAIAIVLAGYGWSLVLISAASSGIGGPVNVLNVPGGTLSMPLRQVIGLSLLVLAAAIFLFSRLNTQHSSHLKVPAIGNAVLVALSLGLLFALIAYQRVQGDSATYYQQKLANGIYLIMTVAVISVFVLALDFYSEQLHISSAINRWGFWGITWLGSFLVFTSLPGFITGLEMRVGVATEASGVSEPSIRLMDASSILSSMPCDIPVYLALQEGDPPADIANQWSHALSGTWAESSGPINSYLWSESMSWDKTDKSSIVSNLLMEFPNTCVVVSPEVSKELSQDVLMSNSGKILSW